MAASAGWLSVRQVIETNDDAVFPQASLGSTDNSRAGLPATSAFAGTLLTTTDPVATMLLSPTVTPGIMMAWLPIQALSLIVIGRTASSLAGNPAWRAEGSVGWPG